MMFVLINMDFSNIVEVLKQNRQSVMNSESVDFFGSVIQILQRTDNDNGYSIWK